MGWFAAKAYGVDEPPTSGDEGISMDLSAVKPLTIEDSVDALVPQVGMTHCNPRGKSRFAGDY